VSDPQNIEQPDELPGEDNAAALSNSGEIADAQPDSEQEAVEAPAREAAEAPGGAAAEAASVGDRSDSEDAAAIEAAAVARAAALAADDDEDAEGIPVDSTATDEEVPPREWFILKVQVNREDSIRDAILRRIKIEGLEEYFGDVIVPTEDVAEFNKSGKRRIVKRKLYPGYILANMSITDDTWFVVRETPGVGDFTGSAGKPTPMDPVDVERILKLSSPEEEDDAQVKTAIPFRVGQRVRVKDGNFQNFEGDVESIDEANGRIIVVITIFNRSTPVELEHWQLEEV
jgi:transcriptional antiterminator NusG